MIPFASHRPFLLLLGFVLFYFYFHVIKFIKHKLCLRPVEDTQQSSFRLVGIMCSLPDLVRYMPPVAWFYSEFLTLCHWVVFGFFSSLVEESVRIQFLIKVGVTHKPSGT